tara:strand:- start:317 stop:724 length:408 start_codon:yes stop_codon:yes gene_type:complete
MKLIQNIIIILFTLNIVMAGCGKCPGDAVKIDKESTVIKTTINTLVTAVPEDGNIEGIVITSCGTCKLGVKGGGCSLWVKIGETVYPVEGTGLHDHGNAHGSEGFCSAVRVAWAKGQVIKNVFHAESFVLVGSSE